MYHASLLRMRENLAVEIDCPRLGLAASNSLELQDCLTLFWYAPYNAERPHPDHHACTLREESRACTRLWRSLRRFQVQCFRSVPQVMLQI